VRRWIGQIVLVNFERRMRLRLGLRLRSFASLRMTRLVRDEDSNDVWNGVSNDLSTLLEFPWNDASSDVLNDASNDA
jgi:hypothetical protein